MLKDNIYGHKHVARNMNIKGVSGEISEEKLEHSVRNWRMGDPHYKMTQNTAELCSAVLWKAELINNELGYLSKSKQRVEDAA